MGSNARRIAIRVHEDASSAGRPLFLPPGAVGRPAFNIIDFDTGETLPAVCKMSLRPAGGGIVADLELAGSGPVAARVRISGQFVGFVLPSSGPPPPCAECGGTGLVDRGDRMTLCKRCGR